MVQFQTRKRLTPWIGMPNGPEKDRLVAREKLTFRWVLIVSIAGFLLGWAY